MSAPAIALELRRLRPEGGARILVKIEGSQLSGEHEDRMALAMVGGSAPSAFSSISSGERSFTCRTHLPDL